MLDLIIPFKNADSNRERNLKFVISKYIEHVKDLNVYIVEQDTDTDLSMFKNINHIKVSYNNDNIHKTELYNIGVKQSKSDYLILADCDVIPEYEILNNIYDYIDETKLVILYDKPFVMLTNDETEELIKTNILTGKTRRGVTNISAALLISRKSYYEIGGHDPQFTGWGPEDIAFFYKASKIIGFKKIKGSVYHMYHDKAPVSMRHKDRQKMLYEILNMSDLELRDYTNKLKEYFYA